MRRQIVLKGRIIEYDLSRKRIVNLNLRVTADGQVRVSCPMRTSLAEVESFLETEADFIFKSLSKASQRMANAARPSTYTDGERVNVFGERCTLCISPDYSIRSVLFEFPYIYIKSDSPELTKRLYQRWRKRKFREKILEMLKYYYPLFRAKGVQPPKGVAFRTMTSRWGVCTPSTGKLTFNYNLFEVPEELIAYVVVHELAHFLEPNHSDRFWAHVADIMPDYKKRRKALQEY